MSTLRDGLAGFGDVLDDVQETDHRAVPRRQEPTSARYHGRHQLNHRYPDGLEKCIGASCAFCPADAIFVEGADNTEAQRFRPANATDGVPDQLPALYRLACASRPAPPAR